MPGCAVPGANCIIPGAVCTSIACDQGCVAARCAAAAAPAGVAAASCPVCGIGGSVPCASPTCGLRPKPELDVRSPFDTEKIIARRMKELGIRPVWEQ